MKVAQKIQRKTQTEVLSLVLEGLSDVTPSCDGYKALCPGHFDRHPSLSVKVGHRGILLKCWAGCQLADICRAIGLKKSDLFFEDPPSRSFRTYGATYEKANLRYCWNWRKQVNELEIIGDCRGLLAKEFLRKVQTIDVTHWTDEQRDRLLEHIFTAMKWVEVSETIQELAFQIRHKMHREEATQ